MNAPLASSTGAINQQTTDNAGPINGKSHFLQTTSNDQLPRPLDWAGYHHSHPLPPLSGVNRQLMPQFTQFTSQMPYVGPMSMSSLNNIQQSYTTEPIPLNNLAINKIDCLDMQSPSELSAVPESIISETAIEDIFTKTGSLSVSREQRRQWR